MQTFQFVVEENEGPFAFIFLTICITDKNYGEQKYSQQQLHHFVTGKKDF